MKITVGMLIVGGFMMSALYATAGAQATKSVNEGVYSAEQAERGRPLYVDTCAACHGDNLEGSGPMPPLAGEDFLRNWEGKTLGDLFEKTHTTMPATAPGTLTPEQAADITAYMLSVSNYPAGTEALGSTMESLLMIKIEAPGQQPEPQAVPTTGPPSAPPGEVPAPAPPPGAPAPAPPPGAPAPAPPPGEPPQQ